MSSQHRIFETMVSFGKKAAGYTGLCLLLSVASPVSAAADKKSEAPKPAAPVAASATKTVASDTKPVGAGFPLMLKGTEIQIDKSAKRSDLAASLKKIIGEEPSLDTEERLQFDFQASADEAPLTIFIDWNKTGTLDALNIDAFAEQQNPVAKQLKEWLTKNAGPGKSSKKEGVESTIWEFQGWKFSFTNGGSGEDSTYSFAITPLPSK